MKSNQRGAISGESTVESTVESTEIRSLQRTGLALGRGGLTGAPQLISKLSPRVDFGTQRHIASICPFKVEASTIFATICYVRNEAAAEVLATAPGRGTRACLTFRLPAVTRVQIRV